MHWLRDHPLIVLRLAIAAIALVAAVFVHRRRKGLKWASESGFPPKELAEAVGSPGEAEGPLKQMEKLIEGDAPGLPDDTMSRHGGR